MSEGNPRGSTGRVVPGPESLLGFLLYESGPSGAPGLHPRHVPTSMLYDSAKQISVHSFIALFTKTVNLITEPDKSRVDETSLASRKTPSPLSSYNDSYHNPSLRLV